MKLDKKLGEVFPPPPYPKSDVELVGAFGELDASTTGAENRLVWFPCAG